MKTNKLFRVNLEKANAIYSVFKICSVFTILLDKFEKSSGYKPEDWRLIRIGIRSR